MSSGIAEEEIKDGSGWHLGGWTVDPDALELIDDTGKHVRLEARTMRMLQLLHERGGEVVTTEEMLEQIWSELLHVEQVGRNEGRDAAFHRRHGQ